MIGKELLQGEKLAYLTSCMCTAVTKYFNLVLCLQQDALV